MDATLRQPSSGIPVQTLGAEVVEGPDAGARAVATCERLTVGTADGNDLVLRDPTVSRYHLELSRRPDGILVLDLDTTNGTFAGGLRLARATAQPGAVLMLGTTKLRLADGAPATVELHAGDCLAGLHGRAPVMRRLMAQVERAAASDVSVLVTGESGSGKELVARALHDLGPRAKGPFVTVDCGSLAPTLVASELFGHERGAFTGADRQHEGAFERASGGTLLLDEVGELPQALQSALLGVLERRRFRRLGGKSDLAVDARVVSATHRDLRADVNSGAFRLDLYYRIAVVVLRVPALRERIDDVPLLVERFLREAGCDAPVEELVSAGAMRTLEVHRWPGNVRELRNWVEATLAMGEAPALDGSLGTAPVPAPVPADTIEPLLGLSYREAREKLLREFESRYLRRLVDHARGNVSRAAREARLDRSHLVDLLRRHGLK